MGAYSKAKGSAFERKVAKMIATTFGVPVKECYRTPLSGGHHIKGDIVMSSPLQKRFPYTIECKHSKAWSLSHLLPLSSLLESWITQCWEQAVLEGGVPLLVVRGNATPIYAIRDAKNFEKWLQTADALRFRWLGRELFITRFSDLLIFESSS